MSALAKASYFGRSAAQGIRHAPFVHVVAISTLAIALFAAGLAYAGMRALDQLIDALGSQVQITVYLPDGSTEEKAHALAESLTQSQHLATTVVTREAALERLSKQLGDLGSAIASLPDNPLPYSVELTVPRERRTPEALRALAQEMRARPDVAGVDYGEQAVERLSALARFLHWAGLVGFLVMAGATIAIVAATLQLGIYARREEIEIQKLVGATDRFVKAPFLLEGILQGAIGGALAVAALWTCFAWMGPRLTEVLSFLSLPSTGRLLTSRQALQLCGCGAVLGLGGSFIAVGRFLRV